MDQMLSGIVSGVLANALTALLAYAGRQAWGSINKDVERALKGNAKWSDLIGQAAATLDWAAQPPTRAKEVKAFLGSSDMEGLVRRLFAAHVEGRFDTISQLRRELTLRFARWLQVPLGEVSQFSSQLHQALVQGCESALQAAVNRGVLSAHEAKSLARHRLIMSEIVFMRRSLGTLARGTMLDPRAVLEFETKYRQQLSVHKHITPPHFDTTRKVAIDKLYVAPSFVKVTRKKDERPIPLTLSDFLKSLYRVVLLGHPGGGKSTLSQRICYDLTVRYTKRTVGGRTLTPILVVLRDYGAQKKERSCSILQFIETACNSRYQLPAVPGAFDAMLCAGRAMVIFDGLDELLDTSYRQEISSDVEAFCNLYPSAPVLVTSREVGYYQAPLDENVFSVFRLTPFDDAQVAEYAKKWFALDTDLQPWQQAERAEAFLKESLVVPDLRSNPLMLALMCNIYRGEGYIPRNRPEVYEKCAVMLFERWDKGRGIMVPLPFESHIGPNMKYLAHWIYSNPPLQSGVTESQLVSEASKYLCDWRFEQKDEAREAASKFIHFCRNRAWVFTDTGTTKSGEKLYQFTHRTFLEYFTAQYLVRTNPTPSLLFDLLKSRIAVTEWDVVAQLAFQLLSKNTEGGGDELLSLVTQEARREVRPERAWNLLSFAARCLEFTVPRPTVVRRVSGSVVGKYLDGEPKLRGRRTTDVPTEAFRNLLVAASENRPAVAQSIQTVTEESLSARDDGRAMRCLEVVLSLPLICQFSTGSRVSESLLREWRVVSVRLLEPFMERVRQLCRVSQGVCSGAVWQDIISVSELLDWHGPEALVSRGSCTVLPSYRMPMADLALWAVQGVPWPEFGSNAVQTAAKLLEAAGQLFLTSALPRTSRLTWVLHHGPWATRSANGSPRGVVTRLSSDALFGAFVLLAAAVEEYPKEMFPEIKWRLSALDAPLDALIPALLARFAPETAAGLGERIEMHGLAEKQQDLVRMWAEGDICFSAVPRRPRLPRSRSSSA